MGNEEIKEMLNEEIKSQIEGLAVLSIGSEEHSAAVDDLTKLYKLKLENEKVAAEHLENVAERKKAVCDSETMLKEAKKDRYIKVGIAAAELILPLMFYGIWMRKGFKFEENGTFTSSTFRNFFGKFKPTK